MFGQRTLIFIFTIIFAALVCSAQPTSFVYQGKLQDTGAAASGAYQFQFTLYDAETGGNQVGITLSDLPVNVFGGIFSVPLNFGGGAFNTQGFRYLEIGVRLNGSGQAYTILTPRQQITSTPYAIRALNSLEADHALTADNSANLGGVPAAQYVITTDTRMSDARVPLPGSPSYIQNTVVPQATSNFNISGEGKADKFSAATQFNIGTFRVLAASNALNNTYAGINAGLANPTGNGNSFFGASAGKANSTGNLNSFFGSEAGISNVSGGANAFFGRAAGKANTEGGGNAFFGTAAGIANITGDNNSFFGTSAGAANTASDNSFFGYTSGYFNTTGWNNAFFGKNSGFKNTTGAANTALGSHAGLQNTTGSNNVFLGYYAGQSNTTENLNTFLGYNTDGAAGITNATAIGANAVVTQSNTMVLGTAAVTVQVPGSLNVANTFTANVLNSSTTYQIDGSTVFSTNGVKNVFAGFDSGTVSTGGFNAFVGTEAGKGNTTGSNNTFMGASAGRNNTTGQNNSYFGGNAGAFATGNDNSVFGHNANSLSFTGNSNAIFGKSAGSVNGADHNSFFGTQSGKGNTSGTGNAFFGDDSGLLNSTGSSNVFIGKNSAPANSIGSNNTFVGFGAGTGITGGMDNVFLGFNSGAVGNVSNAIAIGANVKAVTSNSILLGTANHSVSIPGSTVLGETLEVNGNLNAKSSLTVANGATINGSVSMPFGGFTIDSFGAKFSNGARVLTGLDVISGGVDVIGDSEIDGDLQVTGHVGGATLGAGTITAGTKIQVLNQGTIQTPNISVASKLFLSNFLDSGGDGDFLCQDEDQHYVKLCVADLYQAQTAEMTSGLTTVKSLRPVTYESKGSQRLGLVPRDSASVERSVMKSDAKNVNVLQVIPALVGAIQEQQKQIEEQTKQIAVLKAAICSKDPANVICGKSPDAKEVLSNVKTN